MASLALSIAPELADWIDGEPAKTGVAAIVQANTGTSDPEAAAALLRRRPDTAIQLHSGLTQLAAELKKAAAAPAIEPATPADIDLAAIPQQAPSLTESGTLFAWAAPLISGVVVISFGIVVVVVLTNGVSAGNETAATMLLGTLAAMATSVVSYWVGSSAGSARKDDRLSQITR